MSTTPANERLCLRFRTMATSKEKSAVYATKLLSDKETVDLEYGPKHLLEEPNIWSQKGRFALLLWTYIMQGTVHAVVSATKKNITFETKYCEDERGIDDKLALIKLPLLLQLFVAPLVDHFKPFGSAPYHRRSWLIICQVISSLFLFLLAWNWDSIVFQHEEKCPDIDFLIWLLIPMSFFTAVGDVALDGLAVAALIGPNIAYAGVAGSFGPRFGRRTLDPMLIGVSKAATDFQTALYAIAAANLITCAVVLRVPETGTKSGPGYTLWDTYKGMFRLLRNKRTLALCFISATWQMGLGKVIDSSRDQRHRGWTKDDFSAMGYISMLPNFVCFYAVSIYTAKLDPIRKMPLGLTMFLIASLLEFSSVFFVPYLQTEKNAGYDQSCLSSWLGGSNECEPWVFPFRVGVDTSAMPFEYVMEQIIGAQTSRMTPVAFAGTFTSLVHNAKLAGGTLTENLENDLRNDFDKSLRVDRCKGSFEFFGRQTKIENNETVRYCGQKDWCRPVNGETGMCNPFVDGYTVLVLICMGLFVMWGAVIYFTLAKYINVEKEKYDPDNEEEMIQCTCLRKRTRFRGSTKEEVETETSVSYVAIE